jgi:hypothetical protein
MITVTENQMDNESLQTKKMSFGTQQKNECFFKIDQLSATSAVISSFKLALENTIKTIAENWNALGCVTDNINKYTKINDKLLLCK